MDLITLIICWGLALALVGFGLMGVIVWSASSGQVTPEQLRPFWIKGAIGLLLILGLLLGSCGAGAVQPLPAPAFMR